MTNHPSLPLALIFGLLVIGISTAFYAPAPQHFYADAAQLLGAWELQEVNGEAIADTPGQRSVFLCSEGYWMRSHFQSDPPHFDHTFGGTYDLENDSLELTLEFHSGDSALVGKSYLVQMNLTSEELELRMELDGQQIHERYRRIDTAGTALAGNWRFHSRQRDGEWSPMRPGPRKTLKMLTGTRFQWAAINTETGQFFGTGGGTYTFEGGKYTEYIEYFSRDSSRVGASLSFDGRVEGEDWHHSGLSSRGEPMYEIWRRD